MPEQPEWQNGRQLPLKWLALHAISLRHRERVVDISRLLRDGVHRAVKDNKHLYAAVELLRTQGLANRSAAGGKSKFHHHYAPTQAGRDLAYKLFNVIRCPEPLPVLPRTTRGPLNIPINLPTQWLVLIFLYRQQTVFTSSMMDQMFNTYLQTELTTSKVMTGLSERHWYRGTKRRPLLQAMGEGEVKVRGRTGINGYEAMHFSGTFYTLNELGKQAAETFIEFYRSFDDD